MHDGSNLIEFIQNKKKSCNWLVVTNSFSKEINHFIKLFDCNVLFVLSDSYEVEKIKELLEDHILNRSTFIVELIGNNNDAIYWHYFNDSRKNGTKNLDELTNEFPNLKLLFKEKRIRNSLVDVIYKWDAAKENNGCLFLDLENIENLHELPSEFFKNINYLFIFNTNEFELDQNQIEYFNSLSFKISNGFINSKFFVLLEKDTIKFEIEQLKKENSNSKNELENKKNIIKRFEIEKEELISKLNNQESKISEIEQLKKENTHLHREIFIINDELERIKYLIK